MTSDIDLIPHDYHEKRWRLGLLKRTFLGVAGIVALSLAAHFSLARATKRTSSDIDSLQARAAVTSQQRSALETLDAQNTEMKRQLGLLSSLRSGAAAETMFRTIDRALVDDVWFVKWQFQRAGVVNRTGAETVETGYFIVVTETAENQDGKRPWHVQTHMSIRGQARDHSALSRFVRNLFEQPEIADVRLVKTSLRRNTAFNVVEFDLAIVLNSEVG